MPAGSMLFFMPATFAGLQVDWGHATIWPIVEARARASGRSSKLPQDRRARRLGLRAAGKRSIVELVKVFAMSRPTGNRARERTDRAAA
jgi:hypothetical protein